MSQIVFTPSLFFKYKNCQHWVWHDVFSDPKEKGEVPELAQKLMEDGVLHEEEYIKGIKVTEVDIKDPKEAFKETLELMEKGTEVIYQGAIEVKTGNVLYRGRPDLLEKRKGKSKLGDYYYIPVDIKSSKEASREHKFQLALYAVILEQIQGVYPDKTYIINGEHEKVYLEIDKDKEKMFSYANSIIEILKGNVPPLKLTSGCKNSPWANKCLEEAEKKNDIALIYNLDARGHVKLREEGIKTVQDMANMDPNWMEKVPYVSHKKLERAKLQAQSLINKKPIWMDGEQIPDAPLKIYFDIEGDPLLRVQYLFGFWVAGDPEYKYAKIGHVRKFEKEDRYFVYFLAEQPEEEEQMWKDMLKWMELLPKEGYKVYHYANYEKVQLETLAKMYGGSKNLNDFIDNLVDLFNVVKDAVILPLYFYSIKDVAKSSFVNYKWRHAKAGGAQSIFWYEKWLETGDRRVLNDIIDYNEDDVRATEALHLRLDRGDN